MADQPYYDPNRKKKKEDKGDTGYWVLTGILLFAGAWPIALLLLILKLVSDKKIDRAYQRVTTRYTKTHTADGPTVTFTSKEPRRRAKDTVLHQPKKGGKVLMIIGAVLALIGVLAAAAPLVEWLSWGFSSYLVEEVFTGLGFLAFGGCMYGAGLGMKRRDNRCRQYLNAIGSQRIVMLKTLASIAGVSQRKLCRDLDDMLEDGLLPAGAFIDRKRKCLVLDPAAMPYEKEAHAILTEQAAKETLAERQAAAQAPQPQAETDQQETTPASEYALILQQIRQANDDILDQAMSAKIDRIEAITRSIFSIVEEKPERRQEIRGFFNYYLPTTQKLLNFYAQLEEQPVQSETICESRRNIEGIMDNLVKGFETQLDSLFKADALDISSDISVLENMLAQDGLGSSEQESALARAAARRPAARTMPQTGGMAVQQQDRIN